MKFEVWSYTESDGFPRRRPSFFRRHWKAISAACAVLFIGIAAITSIPARTANRPVFTPDSPYVYDGADVLEPSVVDTLTKLNETLETEADGAQLYIITIDSLPLGQSIEDYSIEQAERIGAGDSKKDNGVLYTFVKSSRQDRLEIGYGLEGRLTDSVCAEILDGAHDYYRRGDIGAGVKDVARDVVNLVQPDTDIDGYFSSYDRDDSTEKSSDALPGYEEDILAVVLIIVIYALVFMMPRPRLSGYIDDSTSRRQSHTSSSHRSSGSSHRSGGGHFGGGGASGSW